MITETILLAEDNPDDVALTLHALREGNLANDIVVARDGEEALEYIFATGLYDGRDAEELPALILLDINMPKVNGLEVLDRIKKNQRTRRVPVVVLTTSDDDADLIKGYDLGANSYIRKPVQFEKFVETVKQLGLYWLVINMPSPR